MWIHHGIYNKSRDSSHILCVLCELSLLFLYVKLYLFAYFPLNDTTFLFFVSFWLFLYVCDNFVTFYLLVTASIGLSFEAHLAGK